MMSLGLSAPDVALGEDSAKAHHIREPNYPPNLWVSTNSVGTTLQITLKFRYHRVG
jgi:hypothetical protein